jgi:hypothetical protein
MVDLVLAGGMYLTVGVLMRERFPESPKYYHMQGQYERAREGLAQIARAIGTEYQGARFVEEERPQLTEER